MIASGGTGVLLAITLTCAAGCGWFWEVQQNQCAGPKASRGLRLALSEEAHRPVVYIGYSDLNSEGSITGAATCSGLLELSFGGGDGVKIVAAYDVTPFGVKLLGHERVSSPTVSAVQPFPTPR